MSFQVSSPASGCSQDVGGSSSESLPSPIQRLEEAASHKREMRLIKNREAARECRRKKKEYVSCLENRVAMLENQNMTLIKELRTLKTFYRHKSD